MDGEEKIPEQSAQPYEKEGVFLFMAEWMTKAILKIRLRPHYTAGPVCRECPPLGA